MSYFTYTYMVTSLSSTLARKDESMAERALCRAKQLVRESARMIHSTLKKRLSNILEAYKNAAQSAVLARTAKDVYIDVARLTKDSGVDFHEYLSYTSAVLQEIRSQMRRKS